MTWVIICKSEIWMANLLVVRYVPNFVESWFSILPLRPCQAWKASQCMSQLPRVLRSLYFPQFRSVRVSSRHAKWEKLEWSNLSKQPGREGFLSKHCKRKQRNDIWGSRWMLDGACHYCESNESNATLAKRISWVENGVSKSKTHGSRNQTQPEIDTQWHTSNVQVFVWFQDFLHRPAPPYPIDFNIIIIGILCSVHALSTCFSRD